MKKIVNCTPHTVKLFEKIAGGEAGEEEDERLLAEFPPSGFVMRLESEKQETLEAFLAESSEGNVVSIPTVSPQKFKKEMKWPTPQDHPDLAAEDVVVLVSMPVGQAVAELGAEIPYHVAGPDTGPDAVIRNEKGQIRGTTRFVYYRKKKLAGRICCGTY